MQGQMWRSTRPPIGIQFQGKRPSGPALSSSGRFGIYTIAKDVVSLDDYITDADPHAKSKAFVVRVAVCKFANAVLEMQGGSNRLGITLRVPINHIGRPHSAADHLPIHAFTYSTAVVSGLPTGAFGLFCD
jgi:hypothetical protein